jgi:twitching motility protein PilT
MHINDLLKIAVERKASDLHLKVGAFPVIRIDGTLIPLADMRRLMQEDTIAMAFSIMSARQKEKFKNNFEIDIAYNVPNLGRFRCNIFQQRGTVGLVLRVIPAKILSIRDLLLPPVLEKICQEQRGLVLCTGTTGSGKSTTLAAMIDKINTERHEHILTIEDPIEFVHQHKGCLVNQREVHQDTQGFAMALRAALREDPDIVLIGELRDLETIESALRIAETGHLTFATLHTNSAAQTINRIIDVFPAHQQGQIRTQLSLVLEGIVCQALLPRADGQGRVVALEIMVPNPAIRNLIRDDKVHQIYSTMQTGQEKLGMQTMNQCLSTLYHKRLITLETAMGASSLKDELEQIIARGAGVVAGAGMQRPGAGLPNRPVGR